MSRWRRTDAGRVAVRSRRAARLRRPGLEPRRPRADAARSASRRSPPPGGRGRRRLRASIDTEPVGYHRSAALPERRRGPRHRRCSAGSCSSCCSRSSAASAARATASRPGPADTRPRPAPLRTSARSTSRASAFRTRGCTSGASSSGRSPRSRRASRYRDGARVEALLARLH